VTLPTPLNSVAITRDGEIVAGGADGRVLFFSPSGELRGEIDSGQTPPSPSPRRGMARSCRRRHPRLGRDHRRGERKVCAPSSAGLPVWSATFFPTTARCHRR
jgi:cytochrome c